jgi:hypothetical protein
MCCTEGLRESTIAAAAFMDSAIAAIFLKLVPIHMINLGLYMLGIIDR